MVYRSFQTRLRTRREHALHLSEAHNWPRESIDCECEFQVGRFRKRKAFDCGRSRCQLCSYVKIFGIASHQDRIRALRFKDSLADYFEESATEQEPG
jgi:hypothetical protein